MAKGDAKGDGERYSMLIGKGAQGDFVNECGGVGETVELSRRQISGIVNFKTVTRRPARMTSWWSIERLNCR